METNEGNKLIAEFMGAKFNENGETIVNNLICNKSNMRYHSSWDWLMPVMEQIKKYAKYNRTNTLFLNWAHNNNNVFDIKLTEATISKTWLACVEFIKWYNENKS